MLEKASSGLIVIVWWSIVSVLLLKSRITPNFESVSTPIIMSNIGFLASFSRGIMSGLTLKTLFVEKSGNFISIFPTFVVLKAPFEVPQILGCVLFLALVCLRSAFLMKIRSPSDPLSRRTRQALFGGRAPSLVTRVATATAETPSPVTTFVILLESLVSIGAALIGVIKFGFFLTFILVSFLFSFLLRPHDPKIQSESESLLSEEE